MGLGFKMNTGTQFMCCTVCALVLCRRALAIKTNVLAIITLISRTYKHAQEHTHTHTQSTRVDSGQVRDVGLRPISEQRLRQTSLAHPARAGPFSVPRTSACRH